MSGTDYSQVTETPGNRVTREALEMLATRYGWALEHAHGKAVLEVGCGAGQGLGLLATRARRVVGGDYTMSLLQMARRQYGSRIPLVRLDGQRLPFGDRTFDLVLMFESIYYLAAPREFVAECRRILAPGGRLLICSANCDAPGFNPSPFSTGYPNADALADMLETAGFQVRLYGAFAARPASLTGRLVTGLKRAAVALHLIPKTMTGKELLKRIFLGRLEPFPAALAGVGAPPTPLSAVRGRTSAFKVIYADGALVPAGADS